MDSEKKIKIAIDGPAASGKSTTAREVANRLNYTYIDSGAMYRAVTLKALQENVPVTDEQRVAKLAEKLKISFGSHPAKTIIYMNGKDVSDAIRTPRIDKNISPVAANPRVREILVRKQQELGRLGGVVMDGRDIGTVVFPDAELKIYLVASVEERARRRLKELQQKGQSLPLEEIMDDIRYRDAQDMGRKHGPLRKAPDAVEIDTTHLTIDQQVEKIVTLAQQIIRDP